MVEWDDETRIAASKPAPGDGTRGRERAYLIVLAGQHVGEMFQLDPDSEMVIGRGGQVGIQIIDEGVSRRHAAIRATGSAPQIEDLGSTNGTFVNGEKVEHPRSLRDGDKIQVGATTILKFTFTDDLEEQYQRHMYESALRDPTTKAYNKKYFLERLESEFAYAKRHATPLALVMLDLDHFKRVNDTYGHLAGDLVLVSLSRRVSTAIRTEDVFARYGGEEFAVISRGIDVEHAAAFAERLRRLIATMDVTHNGARIPVTSSLGVAGLPGAPFDVASDLIAAADEALYDAKRLGRDRVAVWKQSP